MLEDRRCIPFQVNFSFEKSIQIIFKAFSFLDMEKQYKFFLNYEGGAYRFKHS